MEQLSTLKTIEDPTPQQVNVPQIRCSWRAHAEAGSCQDIKCGPGREAHTGAGFLSGIVTPWDTEPGIIHS